MYKLFTFILIIMFLNCSDKSHPIKSGSIYSTNIPLIINTKKYFSFTIIADSLSNSFHELLSFSADSVHGSLHISNRKRHGSGGLFIETEDSIKFYSHGFDYDKSDTDINLFGNLPYEINFSFTRFSGEISFIIEKNIYKGRIDTTEVQKHPDAFYFNSFESLEDISHFNGYGSYHLNYDVPFGGGSRSLLVSGGCIAPHVLYDFNPQTEDGKFILQCWGKAVVGGGGIVLRIKNRRSERQLLGININEWTFLKTSDTLFCPQWKIPGNSDTHSG